ncbi:MAG: CRTAC1 family protein [Verrucomicrobiales bacterium]
MAAEPPASEPEDLVHQDDRIIGRAFRWSFVMLMLGAATIGAVMFALRRQPEQPAPKITTLAPPVRRDPPPAEVPVAHFRDFTREAGVTFVHNNGAYGEKLLPESMGGGVVFFDYDDDSAPDLLFINSTYWPGHMPAGKLPTTPALYHNDGSGHFSDITAGSGLDVAIYGMGAAIGDYDNDGRVDVFISAVGGGHLFHNEGGGKFREVTSAAGVSGDAADWSTSCAFLDYDNDGHLDLFVANYVRWSREIDFEVGYKLVGIGRAYGPPMNFEGAGSRLYHNDANGRFTDVSEKAGILVKNSATGLPAGKALGVAPVDLDRDGWLDLVVANDTVQNFVFHNRRDGTFAEIGALSGIAFDTYGNSRGAMGIDSAYFRNDEAVGIAIGNFANEMSALYISQRSPLNFSDEAIPQGVGPASRLFLKFGTFFFDYDLDGWQDLLFANGHLEEEIGKVQPSQHYAQPALLFWNRGAHGRSGFEVVAVSRVGADLFKPIVGRGSAYADIDRDGDLDVVLTQVGGSPLLLRNEQSLGHHYLRLKLIGTKSNRDAIGARVLARVGPRTHIQQVMPARGYLSQSELPLTFGLGAKETVESIEITWPGGARQEVKDWKIDATTFVQQP